MIEFIKKFKWWLIGITCLGGLVLWLDHWHTFREGSQDAVILAAAAKHRISPALLKAVIWRESWFNPHARGRSGEVGLMQIMKETGSDWAAAEHVRLYVFERLYEPSKNAECGAWYLKKLLSRYGRTDDPLPYALAAYNAGPGNVAKWSTGAAATNSVLFARQIAFPSTKKYVESVTQRFRFYARTFPPRKQPTSGGS
ncbi:MAG: soluble lytic murein transglycosylase [Verrucomicrobiota bacterium]|jgi:soluble lytic murein transglycosylase